MFVVMFVVFFVYKIGGSCMGLRADERSLLHDVVHHPSTTIQSVEWVDESQSGASTLILARNNIIK